METYSIKKISNGELKVVEKHFTLNVDRYCSHKDTLYFDVEGEKDPFCFDMNAFYQTTVVQIQQGLIEAIQYDNGVITMVIRDGNTLKYYTYDFNWAKFNNSMHASALEDIKRLVFKIVSRYNEDPNRYLTSSLKFSRMIFDIIDGDRLPEIDDKDALLRIFEVYNGNKQTFLAVLLQNVVFYDDKGSIVEYKGKLRLRKLNSIKYDVLKQMDLSMMIFAAQNDALDIYKEYLSNVFIPRRVIEYKYVDADGNEIQAPVDQVSAGTIASLAKSVFQTGFNNLKNFASTKGEQIKEKIKGKRRAK